MQDTVILREMLQNTSLETLKVDWPKNLQFNQLIGL